MRPPTLHFVKPSGWAVPVVAIAALGLVAVSSVFPNRVAVDQKGFSRRLGMWSAQQEAQWADISLMRLTNKPGRRGTRTFALVCGETTVPLGNNSADIAVAQQILQAAAKHGIEIVGDEGTEQFLPSETFYTSLDPGDAQSAGARFRLFRETGEPQPARVRHQRTPE